MDDLLGGRIGRGCLGSEEYRDRGFRKDALLDLLIRADRPQKVQLLTLVLVQTLGLYIKYRFRVNGDPAFLLQPLREPLVLLLNFSGYNL